MDILGWFRCRLGSVLSGSCRPSKPRSKWMRPWFHWKDGYHYVLKIHQQWLVGHVFWSTGKSRRCVAFYYALLEKVLKSVVYFYEDHPSKNTPHDRNFWALFSKKCYSAFCKQGDRIQHPQREHLFYERLRRIVNTPQPFHRDIPSRMHLVAQPLRREE